MPPPIHFMKTILHRLQINPTFVGLIFLFAYLDSIKRRISPGQRIDGYVFTPEAALFSLFQALLIFLILQYSFRWLKLRSAGTVPWKKSILSFGKGLLLFLVITHLFGMLISLIFGTWERNYQLEIQLATTTSRVLDFIIYGGFYVALLLFNQFKENQLKLRNYELALVESKISNLKQQLNPHFLFNNLNILDQLIEENPKAASNFLQNFSELYRYTLKTSESSLVSWKEELEFAQNYFQLIREKFGNAYKLEVMLDHPRGKLPPLTLQVLIENAIFHNYGTLENPVKIQIQVGKTLQVSNSLIPFKRARHHGGRGLANLKEQFKLLSKESIKISNKEGLFTVQIPLIP